MIAEGLDWTRLPRHQLESHLPAQPTHLVGREREVEAVRARLRQPEVRILVVTGPGGVGKTRLAVEAAAGLVQDFVRGVYFVPMAPIRSIDLVIPAIALALGARETGGQSLRDSLLELLRAADGPQLLVIDNFEQVADASGQLTELLVACPQLKMLITSRAVLQVYGEYEFPLAPLTLPSAGAGQSLESLRQSEAVRLFEMRAQAADPAMVLSNETASAVGEVCRRLDGLPLAIELAAARVRLLPPAAMLSRLDRRLPLLVGTVRGLPERQQTLRATIDWSYSLLNEDEQLLFRQLGVFVGGWTLEAAHAVICAPNARSGLANWTEHALMNGMQSLLDKSLVRREPRASRTSGEPRFGMLETIGEYALDKVDEHGEADEVLQRHAAYCIWLAEQADPQLLSGASETLFARLEHEHDNLRRALRWCLETRRIEAGFRLAAALWWFWGRGGYLAEGRAVLDGLLSSASRPTTRRARALHAAGSLAFFQGDLAEAHRLCEEELTIQRQLDDQAGALACLESLALIAVRRGDTQTAHARLDEALRIGREVGGQTLLVRLINLATVAHEEHDLDQARALLEEAVADLRTSDLQLNLGAALMNLGTVARDQGDLRTALAVLDEAVQLTERIDERHLMALCLVNKGTVLAAQADLEGARAAFERGLLTLVELGDRGGSAAALQHCSEIAGAQGKFERAVRLAGAAASLRDAIGIPLTPRARTDLEHKLDVARLTLGSGAADAMWAAARSMSLSEAVAYALEREPESPGPLSQREEEVAALVAKGLSNRQIADRLVISARTADNHLQHILNKLGFGSRAQVAAWVVERNQARASTVSRSPGQDE